MDWGGHSKDPPQRGMSPLESSRPSCGWRDKRWGKTVKGFIRPAHLEGTGKVSTCALLGWASLCSVTLPTSMCHGGNRVAVLAYDRLNEQKMASRRKDQGKDQGYEGLVKLVVPRAWT